MLFGRPGIALDQYFLQPGRPIHNMTGAMMGLPELLFDPKMQADPQERYLRPALDWGDIETHGLPVRLKAATLQSERTGTRQAVAVDPDTLAAMSTAYAHGCVYPLKLHPISIDEVLVSQLVCPGTEQMTDGTGLVRLGRLDQTSLVITWLAWWPLPPELMGTDRRLDLTFATTGDTGWMLVASADAPDQMVDYNTPIYAAQSIPDFDAWLDARLDEVATP
jgi:hypothetical protein